MAPMYAVISSGGKQHKVSEGDAVAVELLDVPAGEAVSFTPLLLVDGTTVTTDKSALAKATVAGRVVDRIQGPKIRGFTYKPKSNNRRRWGHRQSYSLVEVTKISAAG